MTGRRDSHKHICVGKIVAAHGIRGEIKLASHVADIAALPRLTDAEGKAFALTITGAHKNLLIARIQGISDRNDAEKLRGTELYAPLSDLPAPVEGEYFYEELVGLKAYSPDGKALGEVIGVHDFGAGDILEFRLADGREEMVSFTEANIPEIHVNEGRLTLCLPETVESGEQTHDGLA